MTCTKWIYKMLKLKTWIEKNTEIASSGTTTKTRLTFHFILFKCDFRFFFVFNVKMFFACVEYCWRNVREMWKWKGPMVKKRIDVDERLMTIKVTHDGEVEVWRTHGWILLYYFSANESINEMINQYKTTSDKSLWRAQRGRQGW